MNDSTDIFDAPAELPPEEVVEAESNRNLLLLGGLAAAAVLGVGAYFLLGGSGDTTEDFVPVAVPAPSASAEAPSGPAVALPPVSKVQLGRNPFKALYVEPAGAAGSGTGAGVQDSPGGTVSPGGTDGSGGGHSSNAPSGDGSAPTLTFDPPPFTTAPGGNGPASAPISPSDPTVTFPIVSGPGSTPIVVVDGGSGGGQQPAPAPAPAPTRSTVALGKVSVDSNKVPTGVFTYNGTQYKGKPGDILDGKLLVISIQQDQTGAWFANLQLGDGSPFEVHQRQTVLVQ